MNPARAAAPRSAKSRWAGSGGRGSTGRTVSRELGGGLDDVFAVVEHEQQAAVGAVLDEAGGGVGGGRRRRGLAGDEGVLAQAESAEDGSGDGGGVVEAGEFDEPAGLGVGGCGVFGEAGLSRTARAGEGDEAQPGQVVVEGGQFGLAADEGVQAGAEVAAGGLRRVDGVCGGLVRRGLRRPGPEQFGVQGGEFGPGVGAETVGEDAARALVRGEGVGGPACGAQGTQLLGA
nr:hypothetical protein [Streptomyces virginiae]